MSIDLTAHLNMDHPVRRNAVAASAPVQAVNGDSAPKTAAKDGDKGEGFSFWDLVDMINPLQHIPVVSTIYREITGDKINNAARIVGGAVFGGFAGAIIGGVNAIAAQETGKDVGELAMAKMGIGQDKTQQKDGAQPVPAHRAIGDGGSNQPPVIEVRPLTERDVIADDKIVTNAAFDKALDAQPATIKQAVAAEPAFRRYSGPPPKMPAKISETAALLPDTKSLDGLQPVAGLTPDTKNVQNVPQDMMAALSKYQAMQGMVANGDDTKPRTSLNRLR